MGVRFECPAGHKLHVKTELVGKRGICPECGAKFIVPSFSGERVAADGGVASNPSVAVSPTASPSAVRKNVPGANPPPAAPSPPAAWYIRPAGGGQFGPASDELFAQWIAEGRVSADSWVWRNGWTDWRASVEALREFSGTVNSGAPLSMPAAIDSELEEDSPFPDLDLGPATVPAAAPLRAAAATPAEMSSADVRRAEIKRRKQRVRTFSILLGIVALAMFVALVFDLTRGNQSAATPEGDVSPAASEPPAAEEPVSPADSVTPTSEAGAAAE